uniref:Hsp70 family protein n=1 Tax=Staphylococcus epidermidis TaxID=1282 RepID=UPI00119D99EF
GENERGVDIDVLEGERGMGCEKKSLGRLELSDIRPAPGGVAQMEVRFDMDKKGIVKVTGKDLGSNKEEKIRIESR